MSKSRRNRIAPPGEIDARLHHYQKEWNKALKEGIEWYKWAYNNLYGQDGGDPARRRTKGKIPRPTETIALNPNRELVKSALEDYKEITKTLRRANGKLARAAGEYYQADPNTLHEDERQAIDFPAKHLPDCGPRYHRKQEELKRKRIEAGGGYGKT